MKASGSTTETYADLGTFDGFLELFLQETGLCRSPLRVRISAARIKQQSARNRQHHKDKDRNNHGAAGHGWVEAEEGSKHVLTARSSREAPKWKDKADREATSNQHAYRKFQAM